MTHTWNLFNAWALVIISWLLLLEFLWHFFRAVCTGGSMWAVAAAGLLCLCIDKVRRLATEELHRARRGDD